MKVYWVTAILLDEVNKRPFSLAIGDYVSDIDLAKDIIKRVRKNHIVYSAWISTLDENDEKQVVFHECYVNTLGVVDRGKV